MISVGESFHHESPYASIPYDPISMAECMSEMIDQGMMIVADIDKKIVGGLGGAIAPVFLNKNYMIAGERFWWVLPEYRGSAGIRLLTAFEQAAKAVGCSHILMISLSGIYQEKVDKLYERAGYYPVEHVFMKVL